MRHAERTAIVGIGNAIAGDEAAGLEALRLLRARWSDDPRLVFHSLEGDVYAVADLLPEAGRFLFLDAICGTPPGEVVICKNHPGGQTPAVQQTDIGAVMKILERIQAVDPFPEWEIWGVTIEPPGELVSRMSSAVEAGVRELVERLDQQLQEAIRSLTVAVP